MRLRRLLFGGDRTAEEAAEIEAEAERKRKEEEEAGRKRREAEASKARRGYKGYFGEGAARGKQLDELDK
jgi:hypothetical protein